MEGPLPPLTKIDDDVEGVEVEVMLALKSMSFYEVTEFYAVSMQNASVICRASSKCTSKL